MLRPLVTHLVVGRGRVSQGQRQNPTQVETRVGMETMVTLRSTTMRLILMRRTQGMFLMPIIGTDHKMAGHQHIKTGAMAPPTPPSLE